MGTDDPIKGLTKRQMEELKERLERELQSCLVCGNIGAEPRRVTTKGVSATLLVCQPCFEKHRLPETRSEA